MNYNKALVNVRAYMGKDSYVEQIIKMCDLEPFKKDWKVWSDNNGNNLILNKNRDAICKKTNPTTFNPKIKDIYFKSPAKQIAENSKFAMISLAESIKDSTQNIFFLWFLGVDGKLRSVSYMHDQWVENKPPLASGINSLKIIIKNNNINGYKVIMGSKKIRGPYDGNVIKSWVSEWPPPANMKLDLLMTNRVIGQKILNDCGEI